MNFKFKVKFISLLTIIAMMFVFVPFSFAAPSNNGKKLDSVVKLDKNNINPIKFNADELKMLPAQAQKFIRTSNDPLVASEATIHVVETTKGGVSQVISSRTYDFSNSEQIKKFDKDKKALDTDFNNGVKSFGVEPLSEDNHGGYMITGINVSYITGTSYDNHFQLHGYWDWQTQAFVTRYDKLGLGWTNGFSSNESTQRALGNRHYDGASITLNKLPYQDPNFFNKGVMWTHASSYSSEGAALAQIYDNSLSDQEIGVWFEYIAPQGPTSEDGWAVDVLNAVFTYFGITLPGAYYYDSFESVYCLP